MNFKYFSLLFIIILIICNLISLAFAQQISENKLFPKLIKIQHNANSSIEITFEPLKEGNFRYKIYRAEHPITKKENLTTATRIADISATALPFNDIPDKEGLYYYTVLAADETTLYATIVPFQNTTVTPIHFIPPLKPIQKAQIKSKQPVPTILSAQKKIPKKVIPQKKVVQRQNSISTSSRIKYNLKYNFYRGKYRRAHSTFTTILRKYDCTLYEKATIYFYLGQTCYYLGNAKLAVRYFIISKDHPAYRLAADAWIEKILEKIE